MRFPSEPDDTFPTLPETTTTTAPDPDATTTSSTSSTTTTTTEPPTTTTTTTTTLPPTTGTGEETTTSSTTTTSTTTTTLPPPSTTTTIAEPPVQVFPPLSSQLAELRALYPLLRVETIQAMVVINNEDRVRVEAGVQPLFRLVEQETVTLAQRLLQDGIRPNELGTVRADLVTDPPPLILLRPLPDDQQAPASQSVADLVAVSLQANEILDAGGTEALRAQAAASVPDVTIDFVQGEAIVRAGQRVTDVQLQAIEMLGLLQPEGDPVPLRALASVAGLMVIIASFYLWRLGRSFWAQPKMVALFGLLMVLAAVAARVPDIVTRDRRELGFMLPAAMFGYLAAHLFDSRVAVLLAIPMAAFTAVGTGDLALTVFAAAATLAPLPLVSSVSSRAQLNTAVILSAVLHAPLAASLSWFFYGSDSIVLSTIVGVGSGLASGVAALGILPFLSSMFGITTTQTLLDLTDRNHPALRLLEEEAPGTFNHSILVGNLAGRAARVVGGNPLFAQAMAYYHDLGKTASPQYFVENQFGVSNPHDLLPPEESSAIIRGHVGEGLRLAREYRIPPEIAQGILTHHGTSLMRFFYHKAQDVYGEEIEAADYRHRGRKPRSKEMVIVMLSDAVEAATRAMVQHEDPTSESIRVLVGDLISEKVDDGQLEESEVTFGELTRIEEAFVDSLIGYYHTRIPYPGFPTPRSTQPA